MSADTGATRAVLHRSSRTRAHLLPRGGHMSARVAQGAVVAVLAIALGGTVTAAASAQGEERAAQATQAADQAQAAAHAKAVTQAVDVADDAIEASTVAQTEGQQAAVDTARIAALQAATDRLEALVDALPEDVRPERERTSRAADRSETEAPATTDEAAEPTPTASDPAAQATPGTTASPAPQPTTAAPVERAEPDDASPATIRDAAAEVAALTDEIRATAEANRTAAAAAQAQADAEAAAAAEAARVAAEQAAQQAAQRAAWKQSLLGYANGKIPASALCGVSWDSAVQLRCDAAEALEQLNTAYVAAFGTNLSISDSYRSYAGQVACRRTKGWLCAAPGTSNHGTGVAIDFGGGIESFGTKQFAWMKSNAGEFSWTHPSWAERGGSKPEAWHWEYVG
ncbi:D-alanyl-D-alanine carboxypeptidase family protein [Cellulomonas fimi]|uniref:D-alanyl-D-alanine carboxypeptidase family protein n=1 Tax=Cellulomonas fimi TaxID=1708 RepID=UPI00234C0DBB|nr:D-alanyl-D-alanine carboxypeptidase family protein [Cellulomonas fimi]MDC7120306.1 D-alanyl-D-alanine carboxypeptidase family protein [Cellulomonas fimi]